MIELIRMAGLPGTVLMLLALVILVLVVRRVMQLAGKSFVPGPEWDAAVNGILFWGAFAAVLGVLGQTVGIYIALTVIQQASDVSPVIIMEGIMISFTSTLLGMLILAVSALAWYALKAWGRRVGRMQAA